MKLVPVKSKASYLRRRRSKQVASRLCLVTCLALLSFRSECFADMGSRDLAGFPGLPDPIDTTSAANESMMCPISNCALENEVVCETKPGWKIEKPIACAASGYAGDDAPVACAAGGCSDIGPYIRMDVGYSIVNSGLIGTQPKSKYSGAPMGSVGVGAKINSMFRFDLNAAYRGFYKYADQYNLPHL